MDLDPGESIDGFLLFAPQLFDYREFELLGHLIRPGDIFLDAGAHIGTYSLVASRLVGAQGRVISVEAASANASVLQTNRDLNQCSNITCVKIGLSDRSEQLPMACSDYGNRSGNSFLKKSSVTEPVSCRPLKEILSGLGVEKIDGAKFDLEGFEFRVLDAYLRALQPEDFPGFIIFEHNNALVVQSGGDVRQLLGSFGYSVTLIADQNYLAVRNPERSSAA
jgi:FkbM family methyltransferase